MRSLGGSGTIRLLCYSMRPEISRTMDIVSGEESGCSKRLCADQNAVLFLPITDRREIEFSYSTKDGMQRIAVQFILYDFTGTEGDVFENHKKLDEHFRSMGISLTMNTEEMDTNISRREPRY